MAGQLPPLVQRFLDKVGRSRDFSISFILHAVLVILFGSTVLFKVVSEPKDIQALVEAPSVDIPKPPTENVKPKEVSAQQALEELSRSMQVPVPQPSVIHGSAEGLDIPISAILSPSPMSSELVAPASVANPGQIDPATLQTIDKFTGKWRVGRPGHTGTREPEYDFTAYIGQYAGGDWNSTVRITNGRIETGSLPNLLYLMSYWTKDRVRTNYKNVKAIRLDSDEIFAVKPPFIFLTGTRDFTLTDKEVENLRNYVRHGGCIWGDSSVPGKGSSFDRAFRREMGRVIGNVDQKFEPLPANHPIFTQGYFPEVKGVAAGLNHYALPVYAMKYLGEVAVIYTANDYGDMWQIGLNKEGGIDLRRDANGNYVAVNRQLYANREAYVRNITPESLARSYKFGANIVMHLLTRWDSRIGRTTPL